jgi:DNA-binding transcriptional LysR family regulator
MSEPYETLAWDDFRLVWAIAETGSLPSAAGRLGLNHSTVFRRLGQIEQAIGTPLFERHRTGYVATTAGEAMAALGTRLAADITAFTRRLAGQNVSPSGEVRITTSDALLVHLLTPLLASFRVAYPDIRLEIVISNPALNLSRRDADIAIRATEQPPPTLVGRRVAGIAWAAYGRAEDVPQPEAVADIAGHRWVAPCDEMTGLKSIAYLRERVAAERIVYRVSSVLGLAEAVENGIGLAYLPCFVGDRCPTLRRLTSPIDALADDLWLLTHADLRHAVRIRVFLDMMALELGRLRPFIEGNRP